MRLAERLLTPAWHRRIKQGVLWEAVFSVLFLIAALADIVRAGEERR